jgi:hypothetical protein
MLIFFRVIVYEMQHVSSPNQRPLKSCLLDQQAQNV